MAEVKTAENLDLGGHKVGYEWVAGRTHPRDPSPGEWLVRKCADCWDVIFRPGTGAGHTRLGYVIQSFSPTDDGERAAKGMANKLVSIAWANYRN